MNAMYTATATASGGRQGHVASAEPPLELNLSIPVSMGGKGGGGTNPEQLFAAGYSACFQSAVMFVAGQQKLDASGCEVTGSVSIGPNDSGPGFTLAVAHVVKLPALDQLIAEQLVRDAHQVCPYSNATRGNIPVEFEVHGR